ncbi:DEAD/DEAH box helicase family protein [Streptomyces lydicus]|uniref:DEAD/DEAH box helicase family protein n=1 Tax=Streptomyces lydicus TaxID=47763 RepID=UPI0036FE2782
MAKALRAHQREAVDAVLCALDLPARALVPKRGLRTVIRATGAGKSLVAVRSAEELHAGRVLVLETVFGSARPDRGSGARGWP